MTVREGDHVRAGDPLFVDKGCPEEGFASPVSGTVSAVERGARRKVLRVKVKADAQQEYADSREGRGRPVGRRGQGRIAEGGTLRLHQPSCRMPSATRPDTEPKAIFVSALRDKPLQGDFEYELKGQEHDFQTGLTALSRIARVCLGIGARQTAEA